MRTNSRSSVRCTEKSPTKSNRRARCAAVLSFFLLVASPPAWAATDAEFYLRLPDEGVSEPIARRTLALELRELDIPGDPRKSGDHADKVSLFVHVAPAEEGWKVQLWDRGELAGSRTISGGGHPSTVGRRVALAAGELARELIARRKRQKRRMLQEEIEEKARLHARQVAEQRRQPAVHGSFHALVLPEGAWGVGPGMAAELNGSHPLRLRLGLGWMAGGLPALAAGSEPGSSPHWSLFDFRAAALWTWQADESDWELGPQLAVSALHLAGAAEADRIPLQRDTWMARGGLAAGWGGSLGRQLELHLGVDAGVVLRNVPLSHGAAEISLGGGYLGTSIGLVVTP